MSAAVEKSTSNHGTSDPEVNETCNRMHETMVAAYGDAGAKPLKEFFTDSSSLFGWKAEVQPKSNSRAAVLAAIQHSIETFKKKYPGLSKVTIDTRNLCYTNYGDVAIAHGVNSITFQDADSKTLKESVIRFTYVMAKKKDAWKVRHFHSSIACCDAAHEQC
jgi:ketosteroid isomerase-like protein